MRCEEGCEQEWKTDRKFDGRFYEGLEALIKSDLAESNDRLFENYHLALF